MGSFLWKNKLYLFYNADLAEMLLKNWSYDEDSLGLFKHLERLLPICSRFANLYSYARVWRAVTEQWEHEPEWLVHLRNKLTEEMKAEAAYFSQSSNLLR